MRAVPGRIRLWREAARADRPAISILDDASLQWPVDGLATSRCLGSLATLFTLYPRSGLREISLFPFNNVLSAGKEVLALALMGDSATVDKALLEPGGAQALWEMVPLQLVGVVLFVCSYIFFVLLSVITLLNLLIAMLTHTFDELLEVCAPP